MATRLITPPAVEPITLTEAKAHLRIDHTDDDTWVSTAIEAVRVYAERFMGRALVTQTWELVIDGFPDDGDIRIPYPPLQSVTSVEYDDSAGVAQTLAASAYYVDTVSEQGWVVATSSGFPGTLDAINTVRIRFVAGYAPTTDSPPDLVANIPQSIKNAMLLHLGVLYANRENVVVGTNAMQLPWGGADILFRQYRVEISMA